ncbi:MAG: NADH dehydrogenase [ubiquinone] 1 alpha subcomplex assembly factor 1 [Patiriisocius sp.]|jgi:NADH dehydrogenase [ubiquinone] 1 alpha subcomplex assembly factor 1
MKIKHIGIIAVLSLSISSFITPNHDNKIIFEFNESANISGWRTLNDGVMGGVSASTFEINKEGNGVFQGEVSTANNGGFASVRYNSSAQVGNSESIKILLKGDGKDYQFRIKKKASDFESYITTFSTSGKWQTIEVKLSDLYPSFRGRKMDRSNFNETEFEEISILIANKKNESFKLVLDKIEFN